MYSHLKRKSKLDQKPNEIGTLVAIIKNVNLPESLFFRRNNLFFE